MEITDTVPWEWLEANNSTAFFVAGMVVFIDAAVHGVDAFMGIPTPPELRGALFAFAFSVIALGLLGFYPGLVDRASTLARISAALGAAAGIGFFVQFLWFTGALLLTAIPMPTGSVSPAILVYKLLIGAAMLLGFILFGVGCARVDVPSRKVGLLVLLTPIVATVVVVVVSMIGSNLPRLGGGVINLGVFSGALLAIGYLIRIESNSPDRAVSMPESTA